MKKLLHLQDLDKSFGQSVLNHASFELQPGEIIGLMVRLLVNQPRLRPCWEWKKPMGRSFSSGSYYAQSSFFRRY